MKSFCPHCQKTDISFLRTFPTVQCLFLKITIGIAFCTPVDLRAAVTLKLTNTCCELAENNMAFVEMVRGCEGHKEVGTLEWGPLAI